MNVTGAIGYRLLRLIDITSFTGHLRLVAKSFREDPPAMMLITPTGSAFALFELLFYGFFRYHSLVAYGLRVNKFIQGFSLD